MARRFKACLSFILAGALCFCPNVFALETSESSSAEITWDELEARYGSSATSRHVSVNQQNRRELEAQLSKQFASLSRGLSNMPEPPDVKGKEISFGQGPQKR